MASRKIKKILVPLDGSKHSFKALDIAIYLAKLSGASITGLCVVSLQPPIYMPGMRSSYKDTITKEARKFLGQAKKISAGSGVSFTECVTYGIPSRDIAEHANKKNFDLVIIGAHGHSAIWEIFLGSTAHSTVHKSKIPVLVVK
ncbi:MAG: universal stress protein [Thaumarchaeota archaeon]|nr:universal stress protein [Nitrososphaerota archaeon]